tara:strand:- start:23 stop:469 length:447 start_codon:yes stop_codon:yes gene_type:complete
MEIKSLTSAISELGFPIVIALISIVILYKLGTYTLKFVQDLVGKQQVDRMKNIEQIKIDTVKAIENLEQNLEEEAHNTRAEITQIKTMVVRLIDRVRLLAEEVYDHDTTARAVWDIGHRKAKHRTRSERREQLQDELADIGANGDTHD